MRQVTALLGIVLLTAPVLGQGREEYLRQRLEETEVTFAGEDVPLDDVIRVLREIGEIDLVVGRSVRETLGEAEAKVRLDVRGWMGYFRLCTQEAVPTFRHVDARVRRRLRGILARQKERPRFLFRALLARGVSPKMARAAAYCRGPWKRINAFGMTRAYPNAWFSKRVLSLETLWSARNRDEIAAALCYVALIVKSRM